MPNLDHHAAASKALEGAAGDAIRALVLAELAEAGLEVGNPSGIDTADTLADLLATLEAYVYGREDDPAALEELAHDLLEARAELAVLEVESLPERDRLRRRLAAERTLDHDLELLRIP